MKFTNIPLAKDVATVGERCASHPYEEVDVCYANLYGFLNVWFSGQGTMFDTEADYNAGHWYELPAGRTTDEAEVGKLAEFITNERTVLFRSVYYADESHIFIS